MWLPNAEPAMVDEQKVGDYLLFLEHASGKGKANGFLGS